MNIVDYKLKDGNEISLEEPGEVPVRIVGVDLKSDEDGDNTIIVTYEPVKGTLAVEHAQLYTDGSMLVRSDDPTIERIYPLPKWIKQHTRNGGRVFRRTVIVVEDWDEVKQELTDD